MTSRSHRPSAAARAEGLSKIYGTGTRGPRAGRRDRRVRAGPLHRDHGPERFGQVDADARVCRPRHADQLAAVYVGDTDLTSLDDKS